MANEAVIIDLGFDNGNVVRRTVAAATAISGGTLCKLTDPNTAAASTAIGDYFAGIAAGDKSSVDGATNHGFYTSGVHDIKCGDIGTAGQAVVLSGSNIIKLATTSTVSGASIALIIGYLEEDSTVNEVVRVRLRGY